MNTKDVALTNYFVKLIQRGQKTIDDVPENMKNQVKEALISAPPIKLRVGEKE